MQWPEQEQEHQVLNWCYSNEIDKQLEKVYNEYGSSDDMYEQEQINKKLVNFHKNRVDKLESKVDKRLVEPKKKHEG